MIYPQYGGEMLTNMKRNLGLLLAVATLSAVTALVPSTAGAAASIIPAAGTVAVPHNAPDDTTALKACPGDTAAAAGFTDTTSTDVDCVKMFGITTGATATTYDPTGTIPRWAMALFIHRMFVPAGVAAAGTTTVPTFTDTSGLSAEILAAISALASHGITLGTTATTFAPDSNVTRAQMATFLDRFLKIAKTATGGAIASTIATLKYNYTDIAGVTSEESEAIIRGYNLGLHGASCTVDLLGVCAGSTAYRPGDDMTRAEMASMLVAALNHTNARPAGVSIQTTSANLTVGTHAVAINVRNADFSAQANTLVDEFYQLHQDALTAVAAFHPILGTCTGTTKTRGNTLCSIDTGDWTSDVRGNIVGTPQTTTAYTTAKWWVQTGTTGAAYVDGTTTTVDTYSITWGAASTIVDATHRTYSQSNPNTLSTTRAALDGITLEDAINTWAGASRTFTVTLSNTTTPTATIKDGYSIKVATTTSDNLGNVALSTAYYPVSGTTASFTTTCPADTSAASLDWHVAIQHTITMGTALGGTGRPTGAADPTAAYGSGVADTGGAGVVGVNCDDTVRLYTAAGTGSESVAIGENNFTLSTAGSLAAVTATAYDQYGDGIAGVGVQVTSVRTTAAGAATTAVAATLTTGAGGVANLSAVVCATGERDVAYSITDPTGNYIDAITATVAAASTVGEGTTIYCSAAGTDGTHQAIANVQEVQTLTDGAGTADGGAIIYGYAGQVTSSTAFGAADDAAKVQALLRGLSTMPDVVVTFSTPVWTVTWPVGMGNAGLITTDSSKLDDAVEMFPQVVAVTTEGVDAVTMDFIDDNPGTDTIMVKKVTTGAGSTPTPVSTTTYHTFVYDSGDNYALDATGDDVATGVLAATMAQFETENASLTAQTTDMTVVYRIATTGSGVSYFVTGT
jgi:hypothetical protein